MANFGERLRLVRETKKMTQKQVAKNFKLAESTISMYERNEREPSFELVERFADYFGVTTDYLLGRSDSPVEYSEEEKQFLIDLSLSDEELFKKYRFAFGDKEYTDEEAKVIINMIRSVQSLMKK